MKRETKRVAIVTGASSGIGRAIALGMAKRGESIVMSARDEVALMRVAREVEAAGGEAFVEAGDVTIEKHREALVARALREKGRLDVLVNNAGRGYYGNARDVKIAELEDLFALNVFAPLGLAQVALDALTATSGTIVMVSSIAGVVAAPRMAAYAASKFALEAMSLSLRAEIAAQNVHVLVVRPGPVDTAFRDNSFVVGEERAGVRPKGATVQTAEAIADKTLRALDARRSVLETSWYVRVASLGARVVPGPFRFVMNRMALKPG